MASAAILTFDIGTTSLKTALFEASGRLLAIDTQEYALLTPRPNIAEMPPERYWQAASAGARAVCARAGVTAEDVQGIGLSSQGQTFIPINAAGEPMSPAIVWLDNRAQSLVEEWTASWLTREAFHRSSGYPWIPSELSIFKIAWLAQHQPEAHHAAMFLCLPDYLIYRMTGEKVTDYVTARMAGMYDLHTDAWAPRLLAAAGIGEEQLPPVVPPGTKVGSLQGAAAEALGLRAGIPVCTGTNDQLAGALGAGNIHPGIISETTGTALAVVATTPTLPVHEAIVMGRHVIPEFSYGMTFNGVSAIILKWFRDLCAPDTSYTEFLADVGQVPPGCDGLIVLPHFAGMTMPHVDPEARGAFIGLTLGHTRAHMARAIMESCACLLKDCLAPIAAQAQAPAQVIRSLGGAARSDEWLQIKADLLGIPVERPLCADAASLGAAMLAATGIGWFADLGQAVTAWYRPDRCFTPDPERTKRYGEVYARYCDLSARLHPRPAAPVR